VASHRDLTRNKRKWNWRGVFGFIVVSTIAIGIFPLTDYALKTLVWWGIPAIVVVVGVFLYLLRDDKDQTPR